MLFIHSSNFIPSQEIYLSTLSLVYVNSYNNNHNENIKYLLNI